MSKKYHVYIGRWQSPHLGHKWIIDRSLEQDKPVLILIRDVETDEKNPFSAEEVKAMLYNAFWNEINVGMVKLQIIPDIASVNYGRGVGYDVICHEGAAPEHIKAISATEIRRKMSEGDDSWKECVIPGAVEWLEKNGKQAAKSS